MLIIYTKCIAYLEMSLHNYMNSNFLNNYKKIYFRRFCNILTILFSYCVFVLMEVVLEQEVHILSRCHGFYGSRLRLMQQRDLLFFIVTLSK